MEAHAQPAGVSNTDRRTALKGPLRSIQFPADTRSSHVAPARTRPCKVRKSPPDHAHALRAFMHSLPGVRSTRDAHGGWGRHWLRHSHSTAHTHR
jgi:hypothetical protein